MRTFSTLMFWPIPVTVANNKPLPFACGIGLLQVVVVCIFKYAYISLAY
jgi:hypothetical protein